MNAEYNADAAGMSGAARRLEGAKEELRALERTTETEVAAVTQGFAGLASHTDGILQLAAGIVSCLEGENVSAALPKVQQLGAAASRFIGDRLRATTGILEMVTKEVELLHQLSVITKAQRAIALQTGALRVLTNIEVSRLGAMGADFQYLANELAQFSRAVTADTHALDNHADQRKAAIEKTREILLAELPALKEKLASVEVDLGRALEEVESGLTRLSSTPAQFRAGVQDIAQQIAGVVTAIQTQDITRQQMEHVQEGLTLVSAKLLSSSSPQKQPAQELAHAFSGLTIQSYQLRTIKETIAGWASQIRTCMEGILRVSAAEVAGIGPVVLEQEKKVAAHLAHIEALERDSQVYSQKIQRTCSGIAHLMQLFTENQQRSKSVRERFRMLSFNSVIEASHLGKKGEAMLAIAKTIAGISEEWGRITGESAQAMQEIVQLVEQSKDLMESFSEASHQRLREALEETREGLETLQTTAAFAVEQCRGMKDTTDKMQAKMSSIGKSGDLLDRCFGRFDIVLAQIDVVRDELKESHPDVERKSDTTEAEQLFSASYTTELEREVMHAALRGGALPVAQQALGGNSVELF